MSLRNTNHLMSSMMNRASGISFDPFIPTGRPQFNPTTGSWVFGLAAFAAGVAINKMIKPEPSNTQNNPTRNPTPPSSSKSDRFGENHMHSLLRDTMAEEARSGDHIDHISAEVARLRDEIAALSAQKEQVRALGNEQERANSQLLEEEFRNVRETLQQLKIEKEDLSRTKQELQNILHSKSNGSPYTEITQEQLDGVQSELTRVKDEQLRITSEYESSKANNSHAIAAINSLQTQLKEKATKLQEAERIEQSLRNDHKVLIETVESLKTQLEFFRSKASQDQSGVTSLKILEESNSKLNEQVSSSLMKTEQQQAALNRLAAEKSHLSQELLQHKEQAKLTEHKMSQLEYALTDAKNTEHLLLQKVEELSALHQNASVDAAQRHQLEQDLNSARLSIKSLESKELALQAKLREAEESIHGGHSHLMISQLTDERDSLQKALNNSNQNFRDLEATYTEQVSNAEQRSGSASTELERASEKEAELNQQISSLLLKVKSLEDERDLFRSRAEVVNLHATDAGNEFMALKQTILTLESEKKSLLNDLDKQKNNAHEAQLKLNKTEAKLDALSKAEAQYQDEISSTQVSISAHQQLKDEFVKQTEDLNHARKEITGLIEKSQYKEQELVSVQRELAQVQAQLAQLSQRSAHLDSQEQSVNTRVSLIQSELSQKDKLIADSKVKEETLKREVDALRQTTQNMESEIKRLNSLQADIGASSSSLMLLQQTETQLRGQLEQASSEIARQHKQMLAAEQARVELEIKQRDESLKLAAIVTENNALKEQLTHLHAQERNQQNLVSQSSREVEKLQHLEQELQLLDQKKSELEGQLLNFQAREQELNAKLNNAEQQLQQVAYERDLLHKELESVKNELTQVISERDELQATCQHLETSLKDLENRKDTASRDKEKLEKIIPLTIQDEMVNPQTPQYEKLDATTFNAPSMELDEEFSSLTSKDLFQSTKPSKSLRKFKGHRKIEDIEAKEQELDSKIEDTLDKNEAEITENEEGEEATRKVYSPNRSFSELLEDSERRKSEKKPVDLETGWDDLDAVALDDDLSKEGKSNTKSLLYVGTAASIAVGSTLGFLYWHAKDAKPDTSTRSTLSATNSYTNQRAEDSTASSSTVNDSEQKSLSKQALELLNKFHSAQDFAEAQLCRLPNRTLKDMKTYKSQDIQDFKVETVTIEKEPLEKAGLTLLVAKIEGSLDGETLEKIAYFEKGRDGELLLDWHSYVDFERVKWQQYLNFDDDKRSEDWHVIVTPDDNPLMDFPEDEFASFDVRGWHPEAYSSVYAYLSKKDPKYTPLMDAIREGQTKFILKLRHHGQDSAALVIDDVVSLSEFYLEDSDDTVSSSFDEISFGDTSY